MSLSGLDRRRHIAPYLHHVANATSTITGAVSARVRLRTKAALGPGSRAAGLAMAFKLIESAQNRWRSVNAPKLVALVRAGAMFRNGVLVERDEAAA